MSKKREKYTFFQVIHHPPIDGLSTRPPKFNKFQKLEFVHLTFHDHNAVKLKVTNKLKNEIKHELPSNDF